MWWALAAWSSAADGQDPLGVGRGVGSADQEARLVDDVVPRLGPQGLGEPARGVVAQNQGRRAELGVPRHPVPIGLSLQFSVDRRRGADEHVALERASLDAVGERVGPHGGVVQRVRPSPSGTAVATCCCSRSCSEPAESTSTGPEGEAAAAVGTRTSTDVAVRTSDTAAAAATHHRPGTRGPGVGMLGGHPVTVTRYRGICTRFCGFAERRR